MQKNPICLAGSFVRPQRVIRSFPASTAQEPQAGPSFSNPVSEHGVKPPVAKESRRERDEGKPRWLIHKEALRRNFPDGWNPPKKISRPSMALLRTLHRTDPQQFSLPTLSEKFKISPEAVRRILKSKWEPTEGNAQKTQAAARQSSDGWVHHERLETDQIPLNLAHTLQSSLPNKPKPTSFSSKIQPQSHQNHVKK